MGHDAETRLLIAERSVAVVGLLTEGATRASGLAAEGRLAEAAAEVAATRWRVDTLLSQPLRPRGPGIVASGGGLPSGHRRRR